MSRASSGQARTSSQSSSVIHISEKRAAKMIDEAAKKNKNPNSKKDIDVKEIIKKASFSPNDIKNKSGVERLGLLLDVVGSLVPIAEGMYRIKPYPNYAYAITNLVNQYQGIEDQLNNMVDYVELSEEIFDLLKPIIEKLILNFGKNMKKEMIGLSKRVENKSAVKDSFNTIYRELGKELQTGLLSLEESLRTHMISK